MTITKYERKNIKKINKAKVFYPKRRNTFIIIMNIILKNRTYI